jgi:MbtH protein
MIDEENDIFRVVVNDLGQYSIWPVGRDCPLGWAGRGIRGTRTECLEWIRATWRIGYELSDEPLPSAPLTDP